MQGSTEEGYVIPPAGLLDPIDHVVLVSDGELFKVLTYLGGVLRADAQFDKQTLVAVGVVRLPGPGA